MVKTTLWFIKQYNTYIKRRPKLCNRPSNRYARTYFINRIIPNMELAIKEWDDMERLTYSIDEEPESRLKKLIKSDESRSKNILSFIKKGKIINET